MLNSSSPKFIFFIEGIDFNLEFESEIAQWLVQIAKSENKSIASIEYIFCTDEYLLEINKTHLNHDFYTDVITFPLAKDPVEATIFISIDRIKDNAKQYNQLFLDELHRVIAHGLLHLLGYNDKSDEQIKQMREMENKVLSIRAFL